MSKKIIISDDGALRRAVWEMLSFLRGKTFTVVNIHSAHMGDFNILEDASVAGSLKIVDSMAIIPLKPRRKLCFDVRESAEIVFVSDTQVRIVRKMSAKDVLTKVIIITGREVQVADKEGSVDTEQKNAE